MPRESAFSASPGVWPTSIGKGQVSLVLRAAVCSRVVSFVDQGIVPVDLEEEVARLRQEKEQLGQELAGHWRPGVEPARS